MPQLRMQRLLADRSCCAAPPPRPGAGLPAIENGMPLPAGTGLSRRSFLSRSAGLALAVYGAARHGPARSSRRASPRPRRQASDERVLVSVFLVRRRRLADAAGPQARRTRSTRSLRPSWRCPRARARAFAERPHACAGTRRLAGLATLHGEGKVTVHARRSATPTPTSRTSPAATTGRSARSTRSAAGAGSGRYLDRHGSADNPLQGLTLGWDLQPSMAARDVPVATVSQPDDTTSTPTASASRSTTPCSTRSATSATRPTSDTGLGQARPRSPPRAAARAARARSTRLSRCRPATRTPPSAAAGLARELLAGWTAAASVVAHRVGRL